ncbi:MAG: UbiX family flavin prenyltransferase [Treponema sp.]|nr:UbiX family flavin prenyltransferase [Treponema sp.]
MGKYLVCITGASGSVYGLRVIRALTEAGHDVHVIVSDWGGRVIKEETGSTFDLWAHTLRLDPRNIFQNNDLFAPAASGSFRLDGTIIVPCSMNTAGAIAGGVSMNLIQRAALVSLKESRPLVLAPRETPLSLVDLRNLVKLAEAGASILPCSPAFYHSPQNIDDLVDFVAGKILDLLHIEHNLFKRWNNLNGEK